MSTTVKAVVEVGQQLLTVKAVLDRGQFIQWVETGSDFSLRSAENFVGFARFVHEKSATVGNLFPATLYLISARDAEPQFVEGVLALAAAPVPPSVAPTSSREFRQLQKPQEGGGEAFVRWQRTMYDIQKVIAL